MLLRLFAFSLVLVTVSGLQWDCQYKVGKTYHYTFTSELVSKVPDTPPDPVSRSGITVNGKVTLTPLNGKSQPILLELFVSGVQETNIDTFYSQEVDRQTFSSIFYPLLNTLHFPTHQSLYGSNLLRGIASTFKIKSCSQTGIYTVDEDTILGRHVSHYTSKVASRGMMDERFDERDKHDRTNTGSYNNLEIIRTVGNIENEGLFLGNTANKHSKFVRDLLNSTSTRHYSYMTSTGNIIYNCVMYERYAPRHIPGYATSSDITVRTSLKLVATAHHDKQTDTLDVSAVISQQLGGFAELKNIKMEHSIPRLNPSSNFVEIASDLKRLLSAGYERTSTLVMKCWLDIVRHLYAGVPYDQSRGIFAAKYDHDVLSWMIDAVNVNGTAHLHLLIHTAIKLSKAHHLTERFIATKQFTPIPPLRMIKWLLKTCDIDRYEEVCALAISSSATNYYHSDTGRVSFVWDIFEYLKNRITKAKNLNERVFFIKSLGNFKLPAVTTYLIDRALYDNKPSVRKAAVATLNYHPQDFVKFEDRENLLRRALKASGVEGASMLYFVLSTARPENVANLLRRAVTTICSSESHPLSTFLHQTISILLDTRSDPFRASEVKGVVESLYNTCQYCLPIPGVEQNSEKPSEHATSSFLFGSELLGSEMRYERFSEPAITHFNSGKTTLVLGFLENFGIVPEVVQSSFDIPDLDVYRRGYTSGEMHVVLAGEQIKSPTFQVGTIAQSDANLLLIDVTVMIPTTSSLPVSYTIAGNLRSDSKLSSSLKSPANIVLDNKLGIYITTEFKLGGVSTGWLTSLSYKTHFQDKYTLTKELSRHTEVLDVTFDVVTGLHTGYHKVPENVNYFLPTTMLNASLSLEKRDSVLPNDFTCRVMLRGPEVVSFGHNSAVFDKKSYLGKWFINNKLIDMYPAQIYELQSDSCIDVYLLQDTDITDMGANNYEEYNYYVNLQALYGLIVIAPNNRVTVFGDKEERNLRLLGKLPDILELLRNSRYFPLDGYSGPELLSVSVERDVANDSFVNQTSLLFYVSDRACGL